MGGNRTFARAIPRTDLICVIDPNQGFAKIWVFNNLMETFRILTVDRSGAVFGIDEIEARNDQEAIDRVSKSSACQIGYGYEIWQGNRRVCAHFESRMSHH